MATYKLPGRVTKCPKCGKPMADCTCKAGGKRK
jgi:hypothetical protein